METWKKILIVVGILWVLYKFPHEIANVFGSIAQALSGMPETSQGG